MNNMFGITRNNIKHNKKTLTIQKFTAKHHTSSICEPLRRVFGFFLIGLPGNRSIFCEKFRNIAQLDEKL